MGYSHYFAYDPVAPSFVAAWPQIVADARLIAWFVQSSLDIPLAAGDGNAKPDLTERRISLNGQAAQGMAHESFTIESTPRKPSGTGTVDLQGGTHFALSDLEGLGFVSACCKTARMPYDLAVTSILLRCHHLTRDAFVIASDGEWGREWHRGVTYWEHARKTGPSPVMVVRVLFDQVESIVCSPLASDLLDGARFACAARRRDVISSPTDR